MCDSLMASLTSCHVQGILSKTLQDNCREHNLCCTSLSAVPNPDHLVSTTMKLALHILEILDSLRVQGVHP
jgi:hypothetical protein